LSWGVEGGGERKGILTFSIVPFSPHRFVTDNGSIKSRVHTGLNGKDQRKVARAIKRARAVGIIPFVGGVSERAASELCERREYTREQQLNVTNKTLPLNSYSYSLARLFRSAQWDVMVGGGSAASAAMPN